MKLSKEKKKKVFRRSISLAVALVMLLNETYIWNSLEDSSIIEPNGKPGITAHADETLDETDPLFIHSPADSNKVNVDLANFTEYSKHCQQFPAYHQNDEITLSIEGGAVFVPGFQGLGTANYPFGGSIQIELLNDQTLNLDAPLFNYVYDHVTLINENSGSNGRIKIARCYDSLEPASETTPLIAGHVRYDSAYAYATDGQSGERTEMKTWKFDVVDPSTGDTFAHFGGLIGSMDNATVSGVVKGAQLDLDVTMNGGAGILLNGEADLGFACGRMEQNTSLSLTYSGTREITGLSTTSGDVGSLVGHMEEDSAFSYTGRQFLASAKEVSTAGGYAGGLVGYNEKGSVTITQPGDNPPATYSIEQYMSGTSGAGGVYGYYKPDVALTFDTSKYTVNCRVNGSGYTGGLFGVLDTDVNVTINGGGDITSNHQSGSCTGYGGLIGQYKADSVSRTLSISSVTSYPTRTSTTTYYGGGIGVIDPTNPSYVEFSSFKTSATGASSLTFGGLASSADNAYIKTTGADITASGYKGGGLVGSLANGVLQISGSNTINSASGEPSDADATKMGKIVGYRDNGLVFMDAGATCTTQSANVDDIGAWGGVIKFGTTATSDSVTTQSLDGKAVFTINESTHAVTVSSATYSTIATVADFAKTAMALQFELTSFLEFTISPAAPSTISMTADVSLAGTGFYGLTRDNDVSSDSTMKRCSYSGTFDGGSKILTFDTGRIYRHIYNGLFGQLSGGTVQNVIFSGNIDVKAKIPTVFVGTAAATATGNFTATNVTVGTEMVHGGDKEMKVGGILGKADSTIGTITVSNCTVNANIHDGNGASDGNASAYIGGVIGQINHDADADKSWNFTDVTVSGKISNDNGSKIGGLIAYIPGSYAGNTNHRTVTLTRIISDGLTVEGKGAAMGGLLGWSWLKTDVNVASVTVQNNSSDSRNKSTVKNNDKGGIGGMIYRATGMWTVTSLDIANIVLTSFGDVGVIVNKGISHDDKADFYNNDKKPSALYLCLPDGYTYNLAIDGSSSFSGVFDELCAYTAPDEASVLRNGNGVISVNTKDNSCSVDTPFYTDATNSSNSYHARTSHGASENPNSRSRYYYNLDTMDSVGTATDTSDSAKLMMWGLNQYACTNLKQYFTDSFSSTITAGTYDMNGYSWYPVDLDKSMTVNGDFIFYSHEFELSENAKKTAETENKYDRTNLENNQHYTMHCGLFRNVASGKILTVGTISFSGNVGRIDGGSGALIRGTVKGTNATTKATVKVDNSGSILLDGIYVYGAESNYAPLLINKVGDYTNLSIANVRTSDSYATSAKVPYISKDGTYPKAASSLIGDVGLEIAPTGITVDFKGMKLDGRTADLTGTNSSTFNSELDTIYGTSRTIFTRATLLNSFKYASGSTGKYTFKWEEDWKETSGTYTHAGLGVTYGKELGYDGTNYPKTGATTSPYYNSQYPDEEFCYSGKVGDVYIYTDPVNGHNTTGRYQYFTTGFIPYVYVKYNTSDNYNQLIVNHGASTALGCGTYDDPYLISDASKLVNFCKWINDTNGGLTDGVEIYIPTGSLTVEDGAITKIGGIWCGDSHAKFTYNADNQKFSGTVDDNSLTISKTVMRTYLAGAYYQIDKEVSSITIGSDSVFDGFGNLRDKTDSFAIFHGVIDGNGGREIINQTKAPLIACSNGSVVKDLTIRTQPATIITLNGTANSFDETADQFNVAYGSVMGKVFGGDNVIDNVHIDLDTMAINLTGTPNLVPVGGYVGVVVNGGVYFRNMDRSDDNGDITYGENLFSKVTFQKKGTAESNVIKDSNKKWLYVNPIIGRVLNGFAVTESDAYRPFDDGTRKYPDGSTEYWAKKKSDGTIGMVKEDDFNESDYELQKVTMQNGTKNYSVADINKSETDKFVMSGIADDNNITVSSAQALYIMSLITESGLGKSTNGFYAQGTYLKPYDDYMSTHRSDYKYIGDKTALTTTEPTSRYATVDTDAKKAANAYLDATGDVSVGHGTDKIPHIIEQYTNKVDDNYPAFGVMGHADITTPANGRFFNLIFSGSDTTFYLPDGYRGLGSLMFGVVNPTSASNNLDNFKDNILCLYSMNGANKALSMNMNMSVYETDGYHTLIGDQVFFKNGFGFINCLQSKPNSTKKFKDVEIKGRVRFETLGDNGNAINYTDANATNKNKPSPTVAAFIGAPVPEKHPNPNTYNLNFENIKLSSMELSGMCYAGGFVGALNLAGEFHFTGCAAEDLKVFAGGSAGGMIGYMRHSDAKVIADFEDGEFGILSITSAMTTGKSSNTDFATDGAGGLIGSRLSSKLTSDENVQISNVTIRGGKSAVNGGYIGCNKNESGTVTNPTIISAGGVIGRAADNTRLKTDKVYVKNLNICGAYAGGFVGKLEGNNSRFIINNSEVTTDAEPKCKIESTHNDNAGAAGGFVGVNATTFSASKITDSVINYYTIEGYKNIGGLVGRNISSLDLITTNITEKSHKLVGDENVGGMVGNLNNGSLLGYNILIKNQTSQKKSGSGGIVYNGYIVGTNNTKPIKLAGFSRQGTIDRDLMVGNSASQSAENYGGGYVVFADYKDEASGSEPNKEYGNMGDMRNVSSEPVNSTKIETEYTIVAKRESDDSLTVKKAYSSVGTPEIDEVIDGLDEGETYEEFSSGTRWANTDPPDYVTDLEQLTTGTRNSNGFYLYFDSLSAHKKIQIGPWYISNDTSIESETTDRPSPYTLDGALPVVHSPSSSTIWFFEKDDSKFKVYTYVSGSKKYITTKSNNTIKLDSTGDSFELLPGGLPNTYIFKKDSTHFLQYSNSGRGVRYYKTPDTNDALVNYYIQILFVKEGEPELQEMEYDSVSYDGTDIDVGTETSSSSGESHQSDYENILAQYTEDTGDITDSTYEVFFTTKTTWENNFDQGLNASPYVTTNPKGLVNSYTHDAVVDGDTVNVTDEQWLTGDGVSSADKNSSAFYKITNDQKDDSNKKRYAYCQELSDDDLVLLDSKLSTSAIEFRGSMGSTIQNFPLLLADDINKYTLTNTINGYLRTLTNTRYDFADNSNSAVFDVGIYKCTYNSTNHEFDVVTTANAANLKLDTIAKKFYMEADKVDTASATPQFTLLDIKFKDPTGETNKIAYHLYVPVYVKKILRFDFYAELKTGTDYYKDAYAKMGAHQLSQALFENLGNPVTMAFEYSYNNTAEDWKQAANSGENLLTNYYKTIKVDRQEWATNTTEGWPAGTRMVLVDARNKDKYYYLDTPASGNISLYSFTDEAGHHYEPVDFQDLMTVTVSKAGEGETGNLVETDDSGSSESVTVGGTTYTATVMDTVTGKKYAYVSDIPDGYKGDLYYVSRVSDVKTELYYLSIFTKSSTANTDNVYRFTMTSTNELSPADPVSEGITHGIGSNKVRNNTTLNYYTGNLYEVKSENLALDVRSDSSDNPKMSETNRSLTVKMTAKVKLTSTALTAGIDGNMGNFRNKADVYQTFLMLYDRHDSSLANDRGIDLSANGGVNDIHYYHAPGDINVELTDSNATAVTDPEDMVDIYEKYIELANRVNLISDLAVSHAVTLQLQFDMVYAPDDLSKQFPKRDEDSQDSIGSMVVGYSKISSTYQGAANSATSISKIDSRLYYTANDASATLRYNVDKTPNHAAGPYSELGINAVEQTDGAMLEVHTTALYDTQKLANSGDYVELTLTLSDKQNGYVEPKIGKPAYSGTPLNIGNYITDLKIYGDVDKDGVLDEGDADVIFTQGSAAVSESDDHVTTQNATIYTVRVKKDMLQTQVANYYIIPITFKVKTGNTALGGVSGYYSNYKVSLTAAMYPTIDSTLYSKPSYAFDHIIYTNARVLPSVVE